ncbi:MAG: hypothetical protein IBX50_18210 [Marinospirillum sp.]|uniref:hypothetical protein n=1 Tax=Marinospirillum sp. TaxID=2183934 RepID=UPI0019F61B09|nr:hypothetical protein [Marinospirillum sp.]MBE0508621.1 hypothetical protein [Marinospirillum sp.]
MYAIEFETDIKNEFIRIPEYEKLKNKHVKVILLAEEMLEKKAQLTKRYPANVPPISFTGDVIDTAPATDWNLNG